MVLYYKFCIFAWNFCIKLEPYQLTVILGLMSTTVFFWKFIPGKPVVTPNSARTDISWSYLDGVAHLQVGHVCPWPQSAPLPSFNTCLDKSKRN